MKKRIAICSSTPYQIFSAISMKHEIYKDANVDLYIFNYFKDAESISDRLLKQGIFNSVKVCNVWDIYVSCRNKYKYIRYLLKCKSVVKNHFDIDKTYDEILYTIIDPVAVVAAYYYKRKNKNLIAVQYEDGLIDYYKKIGRKRAKYEKLLMCPDQFINRTTEYLYNPEMSSAIIENKRKILVDFTDTGLVSQLNAVYDYSAEKNIDKRVIFFDMLDNEEKGLIDPLQIQACKTAVELFTQKEFITKVHPRRRKQIYAQNGMTTYPYQNIPFEILNLNVDMSDKVLISLISTASFSPKIIFNQEPYIIMLYKLADQQLDGSVVEFINRLKNSYHDSSRIMIPSSFEEYVLCLKRIYNVNE